VRPRDVPERRGLLGRGDRLVVSNEEVVSGGGHEDLVRVDGAFWSIYGNTCLQVGPSPRET
jgi:membrane protein implicated in regulation of membrane protease activity